MKKLLNKLAAVAALFLIAAPGLTAQECYTPIEWIPKNSVSGLDRNKNFVDDAIEALPANATVGITLCLNGCATPDDLDRFRRRIGSGHVHRSPYISYVMYENVPVSVAIALGQDGRVAMVEMMRESIPGNDVSVRAARIRSSTEYAGSNVEDVYPAIDGTGVNIAIIDTGVDNEPATTTSGTVHETFPTWKFIAGYDAVMNLEGDPDDIAGHGTAVAGAALGTGGLSGTYRGNAHNAGLIDMKVGTATISDIALARAFDKVIERHIDWNIGVFNLSIYTPNMNSDGTDALSQHINRIVREGVVAVVIAGNNGPANYIGRMAASDFAITVAWADDLATIDRSDDIIDIQSTRGPRWNDGDGISEDELKPDVAAYGENIHTAEKNTTSTYVDQDGTSMAAPQVAGLAALILQANPNMDPLSVKELIQNTAEDYGAPGWDIEFGHGIINGFAAIDHLTSLQTDIAFNDYCGNPGNPNWWLSADVVPVNPAIVEGTPNGITVTIYNNGSTTAANVKVRLGVYNFSNSTADYDICMHTIPSLPPGPYTFTCPWTPEADNLTPPVVHACLKAYIIYTSDTDPTNNCAQRNVNIQQTYSPALFHMTVVNPTGEDADMEIVTEPSARELETRGWKLDMGATTFRMDADDCPKTVTIAMEAGRNAQRVPVNVTVRRRTALGTENLGGVGLIAVNGNGAPRPPDKTIFAGIRHTSLGNARLYSTPAQLTVSNVDAAGDDGVEAWLGEANFWRGTLKEFNVEQLPDNAFVSFSPRGQVQGRDGVLISEMKVTEVDDQAQFSVDFRTAQRRLVVEAYNGANLVATRDNTDGVFANVESLPDNTQITPFRTDDGNVYGEVRLSEATEIEVLGATSSTVVTGDRIIVRSTVRPTLPAHIEKVNILSNGGIPFALTGEAGGAFERPFRAMGNPALEWAEDGRILTASSVKARSAVGVRAEVPALPRYHLTWAGREIRDIPTGAQLSVSARGTLRQAGASELGAVWATRVPDGVRIEADLAPLGADNFIALVYREDRLIYATRNLGAVIGHTSKWPNKGGHIVERSTNGPCFVLAWQEPVEFAFSNSSAATGDELHILPASASDPLLSVSELGVYAVGLDKLQIIGEEGGSAIPVSVGTPGQELPFRLHQNYPNPFDLQTVFKFDLFASGYVELEVFNILGEKVAGVVSRRMEAGTHEVEWKRPSASLASGTYIYKLKVRPGNSDQTFEMQRQMLILD